jgi:hypothetical protein
VLADAGTYAPPTARITASAATASGRASLRIGAVPPRLVKLSRWTLRDATLDRRRYKYGIHYGLASINVSLTDPARR